MAKRIATPCTAPQCPNASVSRGRCAEHEIQRRHHEAQRKREYDQHRPSSSQRGYGVEWRQIRDEYLAHHPACTRCGKVAIDVHHKIPLRRGGSSEWSNLEALCHRCHSSVTMRDSVQGKRRGGEGAVASRGE